MTDLNDALDDIFAGPTGEQRTATKAPADFKPIEFFDPCRKCGGSGRYGQLGGCFTCRGRGKIARKTAPDVRAKNRAAAAKRKADGVQQALESFAARHPAVWAWIEEARATFGFAASMHEAISKWGDLTPKQLAACEASIEKLAAARKARAEREAAAPAADTAGVDRLKAAFDHAIARTQAKGLTLKMPRITIGGMVISPAKATSSNPGALYVKSAGTYLGKIAAGRFFASRECGADQQAKVLAFIADPKAAATAYGLETGVCCVCNATLTSEWKHKGIGPICAEKMGWA